MFRRHVADAVLLAACHGTLNSTQLLQLVNQLKQKSMEEGSGIIQSSVKQSIFIGEMDFTVQDASFMLSLIIGDGGGGEGNADGKVTHLVFTTFVLGIRSMLNNAAQHSAVEVYNKREKKLLTLVLGLFRESFEIDLCNGDIDEDRHKHDTKVVPVHSPSEKSPEPRSKKALATSTGNAERRQTESEYGTYEKHGVSTLDIENNANGVDLDSRLVAKKDTMDVSQAIDAAGSAAANDAAALESSDLLIAHEAIHQHHERKLSQQLLQRQAMAGGKLLVRRKARNILKKSKLFSGFSMAVVTKIVEKMQLRKFPTGTRICIQKDEGTQMGRCGRGCDVLWCCADFGFFHFLISYLLQHMNFTS